MSSRSPLLSAGVSLSMSASWEAKNARHSAGRRATARKMLGTNPDLSATRSIRSRRSSESSSSDGTSNTGRTLVSAPRYRRDMQTLRVHGREVAYERSGSGSAIVLVHGIAGDASEWSPVMGGVPRRFDVIAPDLPGHGSSGRLRGDHSIGAFACWLRDLVEALDVEHATFVGHSPGGGVVMQFAYQFPQYVERMVLVSSGGLGREVSPLIRAAALPGAELVLGLVGGAAKVAQPVLSAVGIDERSERGELVHRIAGLTHGDRRAGVVRAPRAGAGPAGTG